MNLVLDAITIKYLDFSGRASRKEYWLFTLFYSILYVIANAIDAGFDFYEEESGFGITSFIVWAAFIIPGLAIAFRRLHDTFRSGWWLLILLIPLLGLIGFIVLMCLKGTDGANRYGFSPLDEMEAIEEESEDNKVVERKKPLNKGKKKFGRRV